LLQQNENVKNVDPTIKMELQYFDKFEVLLPEEQCCSNILQCRSWAKNASNIKNKNGNVLPEANMIQHFENCETILPKTTVFFNILKNKKMLPKATCGSNILDNFENVASQSKL